MAASPQDARTMFAYSVVNRSLGTCLHRMKKSEKFIRFFRKKDGVMSLIGDGSLESHKWPFGLALSGANSQVTSTFSFFFSRMQSLKFVLFHSGV